MKHASSRATAVTATFWCFPRMVQTGYIRYSPNRAHG
jgi:hypothetical protein